MDNADILTKDEIIKLNYESENPTVSARVLYDLFRNTLIVDFSEP